MITYEVVVFSGGSRLWFLNGELHREDGPAVEWADGSTKKWYLNGKRHREDGPAVERPNGTKEWFLDDIKVAEQEVMNPVREMTVEEISRALGFEVKVVKIEELV